MKNNAIGMFDSGIGGLGIAAAVHDLLPQEKIIYLADSKNCPYGIKKTQEIREICQKNTETLLNKYEVKMIVVACNTASVSALEFLREKFPAIPIVGVVPVIKTAAKMSKTGEFVVLSTPNTIASQAYMNLVQNFASDFNVHSIPCPGLADAIESGQSYQTLRSIIRQCIQAYKIKEENIENVDVWVLGCTHYTIIKDIIKSVIGEDKILIDSNEAVARNAKKVLDDNNMRSSRPTVGEITFLSNSSIAIPAPVAKVFPQATFKRV